jgi:1-acyl-sn-glycerol-3-phosphate acyltransferase
MLVLGKDLLTPLERFQIRFVRRTFEPGIVDRVVRALQHQIGSRWIEAGTMRIRHVHGLDRLPEMRSDQSYICVANHRSFFDLYVVTGYLVRRGMPHRLVFPVRSNFFYDHPLGWVVNGTMSFFAMYPPVFRQRERAALNLAGIDEVVRLAKRGGAFIGLHPEGTRNKGDNPYELLPAQSGVGRIIHSAKVTVLPVFVNGLGNDLLEQLAGNFTRKGTPIVVVFGKPIDYGALLGEPSSPRVHKQVAEKTLAAIAALGEEEREIRKGL